jgi:hypothetical protein
LTPYFIFFSIIIFLYFLSFFGGKNLKLIAVFFGALIAILLAGFRDGVGVDDIGYEYYFANVQSLFLNLSGEAGYFSEPRPYELGFYYLMILSKFIYPDFLFFKIVSSAVIIFCILRAYVLLIKDYDFAFFAFISLLFIDIVFHQFRNGLAMGFVILAIAYYCNGRHWGYFVCSLIAYSFHISAIFVFFLPLLFFFRFNTVSVIFVLLLSFVLKEIELFRLAVELLFSGGGAEASFFEGKVVRKFQHPKYQDMPIEFGLGAVKSLIIISALIIRDRIRPLTARELFLAKAYLFGFSVFIILSNYGIFASRLFRYFGLIEPLVMFSTLLILRDKIIIFIVFILYFFLNLYSSSSNFLSFPYNSSI